MPNKKLLTRRMFMKKIDRVKSKSHQSAYVKGYGAAMHGEGLQACGYKNKAGGVGFRNAFRKGFKDAVQEVIE